MLMGIQVKTMKVQEWELFLHLLLHIKSILLDGFYCEAVTGTWMYWSLQSELTAIIQQKISLQDTPWCHHDPLVCGLPFWNLEFGITTVAILVFWSHMWTKRTLLYRLFHSKWDHNLQNEHHICVEEDLKLEIKTINLSGNCLLR